MLAGLACPSVSGELTWDKSNPELAVSFSLTPGVLRSTVQSKTPPELLLHLNVTFPLSGTTYPPGIGTASADRVTVKTSTDLLDSCTYCIASLASYGVKRHTIGTDLRQLLQQLENMSLLSRRQHRERVGLPFRLLFVAS